MIRNRLKELMDERGLKATRMANDINNLSRNTINSTVSNSGKMIQFETINSLCQYLGVTPADFFEYLPFDVEVTINADNKPQVPLDEPNKPIINPFFLNLYLKKIDNNYLSGETKKTYELSIISENTVKFYPSIFGDNYVMNDPKFKVVLGNPPIKENMESQKDDFFDFWNNDLTDGFKRVMQQKITSAVYDYFKKIKSDYGYDLFEFELPTSFSLNFRFDDFESDYSKLENGVNIHDYDLPF